MDYKVSLQTVAACPTAVVAHATNWEEFPRIWVRLLDEVYAFLRNGGAAQDRPERDAVPGRRAERRGRRAEDPAELETQVSYLIR